MMTIMVAALLALGTAYAVGIILGTVRHYRGAAGALRQMLADCRDEQQEVRIMVCEWTVSETASVLRPDFSRPRAAPLAGHGLRAAA